jgi:hypothetical protein
MLNTLNISISLDCRFKAAKKGKGDEVKKGTGQKMGSAEKDITLGNNNIAVSGRFSGSLNLSQRRGKLPSPTSRF